MCNFRPRRRRTHDLTTSGRAASDSGVQAMISRFTPIGFFLVLTATSCNVRLGVRQALTPMASVDCLASALATSPDVVEVTKQQDEVFFVVLRDSTANRYAWKSRNWRNAGIMTSAPDSTRAISVHLIWSGMKHPPAAEERAATAVVRRVLAHLREVCAPDSPSDVECVWDSGRRAESCG